MFVTHKREDGSYQLLKDHLTGVAERAEKFAAAIGTPEEGRRAGLLHDIGKYSSNGQKRQRDPEHTARVDHATAGAQEALRMKDAPAAFAVAGHHGGLPDIGMAEGTLVAKKKKRLVGGDDPSAWKSEITVDNQTDLPDWVISHPESAEAAMYTRMLFSCLVDADFLDTEQALQGEKPRGGYANVKELLARLVRSVEPWLKEPKTALCARRNEILSRCLKGGDDARGLYTLTVPTGGGKTVASLAFALSHAVAQGMERVIYVIPYTSIIEQTANTFAERIGRENVLEHHSQAELGKDEEDADDVETQRRRLACENWDAPVIVTTAVQFFESLYATRTSRCRKLHNMARSVIVFDEAQTLPMPMLKPCVFAVAELVRHYGATAVLCTATQPALGKLFAAYAPEYPMREIAPDPDGLFDFFRRVTFRQEGQLTDAEVAQRLTEDKRVLCVVNSRKRARAIYQMLPEEGRYHLSTLMTAQDREQTLELVRQRLKNGETCRVVSTSLIEAGVDVDFPAVWREKAGLDSILQAAGRCNREGENALADSVVHIFSGEGNIPAEVKRRISPLEYVVANYADINTREAIAAYFGRLLWATGDAALDVEGVLQLEAKLMFRQAADAFKMIPDTSVTVYIPTAGNEEDLRKLRLGQVSRTLLRRLGRTAVNIQRNEYEQLINAGAVEPHDEDSFGILLNPDAYSTECGLNVQCNGGAALFM